MSTLAAKLDKLETIFKEANAPILQHFNPGFPEKEIKKVFTENGIPEHPDLIALYQWHNGMKSIYGHNSSQVDIAPMGSFPNLNEMLALRNDFLDFYAEFEGWNDIHFDVEKVHEYVPILSGGEDDMHVLKTSTGEIYYSSPGIQIFCDEVKFPSLSYMLDFIIECYQDGSLRMHPQEGLIDSREYWKKFGIE